MTVAFQASSSPASFIPVEEVARDALSALPEATTREAQASHIANAILAVFDNYYVRSRHIPYLAKEAFETRNWPETTNLSRERLDIYGRNLDALIPLLKQSWPQFADERGFWVEVEAQYLTQIRERYEADLAFAFLRSTRRLMRQGEWAPVSYFAGRQKEIVPHDNGPTAIRTFTCIWPVKNETVIDLLQVPGFNAPFRDIVDDARLIAMRINETLEAATNSDISGASITIEMIDGGFFRNRGAYLVGRIKQPSGPDIPLALALLNEKDGIYVDAVLFEADRLHYVFSSALANFHVTAEAYHQLAHFLHSVMPKRPLGLHYSTIGFNHVGKVAVMRELQAEHNTATEQLDFALGFRGTVAIGFSTPSSRYVLKVIRDQPAEGYKWDTFPGVDAILQKYRAVHETDRAGSMLDNIIYDNVRLDREWFTPQLLQEFANAAPDSVKILHRYVLFRHLIVQMKLTPVPEFLKKASPTEAKAAIRELGTCIANNAAANIFNKDLDARNYGVSRIGRVYLFDYDAVEPLTGIKVRTNLDRIEGEEDIPDWFFEKGTIFLPEEMLVGLRVDDPDLRRAFREINGELMTTAYWEGMQRALNAGLVPKVRAYPTHMRLRASRH
ncbi:Isocitrate dehydrogenase kinase/phosphatase [Candidatus Filomicrobium marinum]|uniref:Isocitrate dehydrogenase kinase/phosphatase n=2 Tax=Filomicrobium TaxID=119044 RepID=A0A0D6JJJ4_9HYPH|nr:MULTISPECIES: isocitrate dehydrogenase kinase/phosphatase AceK regulatory subunit [Filomicrobium]MCV0371564.1 bifunctional isocitrate dehydrogenase kinase/phosphatase [Filomicrobium sp.]CFX54209.1 Isocitrate dehydrogenase kinase/phosphatase [Candidatus Filomicrobium marinum]CPR22133.1 Isocitrate dehydrogenase kinase/phosphatase [Candidatus Filomicrobium marinum]SDO95403.1 isocitrate dehydrogenase kinase/phosphatase [Filomicrobium insigne]